jgi:hypothetical protein
MNLQYYDNPWPYVVIDNFLPEDLLQEVISNINSDDLIYTSLGSSGRFIPPPLSDKIVKITKELFNKSFDKLNISNRNKEYNNIRTLIVYRTPNHKYPVHVDNYEKLFTVVIYLSPEEADGTSIHNINETYSHDVEWKVNRALAFIPTNNTWHSINSKIPTTRTTLNINVMVN